MKMYADFDYFIVDDGFALILKPLRLFTIFKNLQKIDTGLLVICVKSAAEVFVERKAWKVKHRIF